MGANPGGKFTFSDLRAARLSGAKIPMLTCYDYTTARLMSQAGVPMLLVGDSAGNVILGHQTTLPVPLHFMIELAAGVRRGVPDVLLVADMPFGSYHGSTMRAVRNVLRMVQLSGSDCVKLEAAASQLPAIRELSDAGVAIMAHLGLRPQTVGVMGGYKAQGRTASDASAIVALSREMESAGAASILLEAVPGEVSEAVVHAVGIPVIGCGAGAACHGHVVVTQDMLNLTPGPPRFVPKIGDMASPMIDALREYVRQVSSGEYPAPAQGYSMPPQQARQFLENQKNQVPSPGPGQPEVRNEK